MTVPIGSTAIERLNSRSFTKSRLHAFHYRPLLLAKSSFNVRFSHIGLFYLKYFIQFHPIIFDNPS